jgi:hypothetical protein
MPLKLHSAKFHGISKPHENGCENRAQSCETNHEFKFVGDAPKTP